MSGGLRRRTIRPFGAAHLDFFCRRFRRDVVVERLRLALLDVRVDDDADDDVLVAGKRATDAQSVALTEDAVRFGVLAVHFDLAAFTGALGFRARLEQAG